MKRLREYERLAGLYDDLWSHRIEQVYPLVSGLVRDRHLGGCRVLDIGCGTGLLAEKLCQDGHRVDAVDRSEQMLFEARERRVHRARFFRGDMCRISPQREYRLITCTLGSINYLQDKEQLEQLFLMVSSALLPGGFFIFDSKTERLYINQHSETSLEDINGYRFIQEKSYDKRWKKASVLFRFPDGRWESHTQYPHSLFDLLEPVRRAGLFVYRCYGGYRGELYNRESERLVCVVRYASKLR